MKLTRKPDRIRLAALSASILLIFTLAADCRRGGEAGARSSTGEDVPGSEAQAILKIGDHVLTRSDFDKYIDSLLGPEKGTLSTNVMSRLYDDFVDEQFLLQAARSQGVSLTTEEKQDFVDKWNRDALSQDKEAFRPGDSLDRFFDKMLVEKYMNLLVKDVVAGDEEITAYYRDHRTEFQEPERVKVSQILLPTEEKALEVLGRLRDSGEDEFRTAAGKESIGPEAADGGRMGVFRAGQLPRDLGKVVFSLGQGEMSGIHRSDYGYHIFRIDQRFEAEETPLEEAALSIRLKILEAKVKEARDAHLRRLKETMEWSSYTENLPFAYLKENS